MSFVKLSNVNMIYDKQHHILKDLNLSSGACIMLPVTPITGRMGIPSFYI